MLNNKGFAVSSVLYTLLIAFLLFLGAALAQLSSSSSLIGKANDDIVNGTRFKDKDNIANGTKFKAIQLREGVCGPDDSAWYERNDIVKIESRYGTVYWPKDFEVQGIDDIEIDINGHTIKSGRSDGNKIIVSDHNPDCKYNNCIRKLIFTDSLTRDNTSVDIADICK